MPGLHSRFFALLLVLACIPAMAVELRAVTEEWPPFNYQNDGHPAGLAIEMLEAAEKRMGKNIPVEFLPWERAYRIAQREPNVLIFTMARKPDRETLFKWVYPIAPRTIHLYKLSKRTDIRLQSLEDAKAFMVGTQGESDAATMDLLKRGFRRGVNLDMLYGSDVINLNKLLLGRIDLLASSELQLAHNARALGRPFSDFERTLALSDSSEKYYFAFSLSTPDAQVEQLRQAFEGLNSDGSLERIRRKFLPQEARR